MSCLRRKPLLVWVVIILPCLGVPGLGAVETPPEDARWWTSNADFMELEEVSRPPADGWGLAVWDNGTPTADERRRLYLDGQLQAAEEIRFVSRGKPEYIRRTDADGNELIVTRFRYRPDGTVRRVERCGQDQCVTIRYAPPGVAGLESIRGEAYVLDIRYGASSRPEYIRRERTDEPVIEEWYEYRDGHLVTTRTVQGPDETRRRYQAGRLVSEEINRNDRRVSTVTLRRAPDGTILERHSETRTRVERELFFPDSEDVLRERRINGELVEQEAVDPGGHRVITRLQRGDVLYRTWYDGDAMIRREVYLDGEIVHVDEPEV